MCVCVYVCKWLQDKNTRYLKWVGMQAFAVVYGFLALRFLRMFEAGFVLDFFCAIDSSFLPVNPFEINHLWQA